jgi:hypothetical protein
VVPGGSHMGKATKARLRDTNKNRSFFMTPIPGPWGRRSDSNSSRRHVWLAMASRDVRDDVVCPHTVQNDHFNPPVPGSSTAC